MKTGTAVPRASKARDQESTGTGWRMLALVSATVLAGCGTLSGGGSGKSGPQAGADAPTKRGGGYYLDDGPGTNPPSNLDEIPDAVPRAEPLHRGTARPYSVMGRNYVPMTEHRAYRARGIATWYGRRYHGKQTSSGEIYDMYAMTAAHTVLPIPSYVRVTNLANGRSVVVRVNDRGPFLEERLIDLSYVAAHKLDIVRSGSAMVEVESVFSGSAPASPAAPMEAAREPLTVAAQSPPEVRMSAIGEVSPTAAAIEGGHFLQLGAFAVRANAERFVDRAKTQLGAIAAPLSIVPGGDLFRVHAGPFSSRADALQAADRLSQTLGGTPVLIAPR